MAAGLPPELWHLVAGAVSPCSQTRGCCSYFACSSGHVQSSVSNTVRKRMLTSAIMDSRCDHLRVLLKDKRTAALFPRECWWGTFLEPAVLHHVRSGNLSTLKFLVEECGLSHDGFQFSNRSIPCAALCGHFDTAVWLVENMQAHVNNYYSFDLLPSALLVHLRQQRLPPGWRSLASS